MAKKEYIIAPAGHGKTHYISRLVNDLTEKKALVLTHTNAGLNSLVRKLKKERVPPEKYDVFTIDSFSVKYATAYPHISCVLKQPQTNSEYEKCRKGVLKVFEMGFLQNFLDSTYSLIIVDEYQDCSEIQHKFILKISANIDYVILGDPMQGIFDFQGQTTLVNWEDIRKDFTESSIKLEDPWRWRQKGSDGKSHEELGEWVKDARNKMIEGEEIEFSGVDIDFYDIGNEATKVFESIKPTSPKLPLATITESVKKRKIRAAIKYDDEVLILVDDPTALGVIRQKMSYGLYNNVQVIDAMDFAPLNDFLRAVEGDNAQGVFEGISTLLKMCITKIDSLFLKQIETKVKKLWDIGNRKTIAKLRFMPINKDDEKLKKIINHLYQLFLNVLEKNAMARIITLFDLIIAIEKSLHHLYVKEAGDRKINGNIYRRDILSSVKSALSRYIEQGGKKNLEEYGKQIRQRISYVGRGFKKVIATTLLIKGLEYDHVIINNPASFGTKHLYVALSRAKRKITILGNNRRIRKEKPENL